LWKKEFGKSIFTILSTQYLLNDTLIEEVYKIKKKIYPDNFYDNIKVLDFAKKFYQIPNSKNVICTTTTYDVVNKVLKNKNINNYFYAIYDRANVKEQKPRPNIYIYAARQFINPEKINIFEDSDVGIQAVEAFKQINPNTTIYKIEGDNGYSVE